MSIVKVLACLQLQEIKALPQVEDSKHCRVKGKTKVAQLSEGGRHQAAQRNAC